MSFQNHFSSQSKEYARFRPRYPAELFQWLASVSPGRTLAWDCGTGSGQAAVALAEYFERVVASDPSAEQIAHAGPHPRVQYLVGPAEEPPAAARGADLVTCAQALHWFDHARFYPALRATLRPGGVFAAWGYGLMSISPEVDAVVNDYYTNIVGPYWPPDRVHIENRYKSVPFPLGHIAAPDFAMTADWSLDVLLGYLDTWSATRRYLADRGEHPLARVRDDMARAWGNAPFRHVKWPLFAIVGR
jgi:SAM-dependent methyltransferase